MGGGIKACIAEIEGWWGVEVEEFVNEMSCEEEALGLGDW